MNTELPGACALVALGLYSKYCQERSDIISAFWDDILDGDEVEKMFDRLDMVLGTLTDISQLPSSEGGCDEIQAEV